MSTTYLSVREVADRWRVSRMTVHRLIGNGSLGATRIGATFRIDEAECDRYIADNQTPRQPQAASR